MRIESPYDLHALQAFRQRSLQQGDVIQVFGQTLRLEADHGDTLIFRDLKKLQEHAHADPQRKN